MKKYVGSKFNINKVQNRTLLDDIKYYLYYAPVRFLDMLPRRIYWFMQRGFRGYGDNDTWDFDSYLANVIIGGLKQFKKYYHGKEPTKSQLNDIIKGFEANLKLIDEHIPHDSEQYRELNNKFHRGMYLLEKYFNYLWD